MPTETFIATKDNFLQSNAPNDNNGISTMLNIYSNVYYALLTFDTTAYTGGSSAITSAIFSLYYYNKIQDPVGQTVNVYKLRRNDWEEGTKNGALGTSSWNQYKSGANWEVAGAKGTTYDIDTSLSASTTYPASYGWVDFDITDIVKDAIDNVSGIVNIWVGFSSANGKYAYHYSKDEATETTKRPKLVINYTIPVTFEVIDTVSLVESIIATIITPISFIVSEIITVADSIKVKKMWEYIAKNATTWTTKAKNATTWIWKNK